MATTSKLLVEGHSEESVIPQICKRCGIVHSFDIESAGGLEKLKSAFKTLLKSTNTLRKLWVIIDADNNFKGAWESMKYILDASGRYQIDKNLSLPIDGLIINPLNPEDLTIGIWIMPNNTDVGMLEDFMMRLIPEEDKLLKEADNITVKLNSKRGDYENMFKESHLSKARMHTWLSWQDMPGETLSLAVKKKLFDTDKELCSRFVKWLDQLNM